MLLRWLPGLGEVEKQTHRKPPQQNADPPVDFSDLSETVPDRAGQIDLLRKFQSHQRNDLEQLQARFEQADMAGTAYAAHRIKGASRMVGARELASAYAAIEQAAKQNDHDAVCLGFQLLADAVNRFENYLSMLSDAE